MSSQPQQPFRAPIESPIVTKSTGSLTPAWQQHLMLTSQQLKTPANQTAPSSSSDPGSFGQMALDTSGNLYVYTGTKWQRVALQDF